MVSDREMKNLDWSKFGDVEKQMDYYSKVVSQMAAEPVTPSANLSEINEALVRVVMAQDSYDGVIAFRICGICKSEEAAITVFKDTLDKYEDYFTEADNPIIETQYASTNNQQDGGDYCEIVVEKMALLE